MNIPASVDEYLSWTTLTETSHTPSQISVHNMSRNDNDMDHESSHFRGTLPSSAQVNVKKGLPGKSRSGNNPFTRDLSPKGHKESTNPYARLASDRTRRATKSTDSRADDAPHIIAKLHAMFFLEKKSNHTSLIVSWNSEASFILKFSPYWKTPFYFDWVRFPNSSYLDIIEELFPSKEHELREQSAHNLTLESPLIMCPFSKRLAFLSTQKNSAWGKEAYTCMIYDKGSTNTMTCISPLIGERKCQLLALSPNGQYAAFGGDANGHGKHIRGLFSVTVRRLLDRMIVCEFQIPAAPSAVKAMSFDSDSNRLAVLCGGEEGSQISLYTLEFKSRKGICEHVIVKEWNPRAFIYRLSPILLFLPEDSIIIMFHTDGLFHPVAKFSMSERSAVVDTISRTSDTLVVQPEGNLYGIRIMREQWEAGDNPIVVEPTSLRF